MWSRSATASRRRVSWRITNVLALRRWPNSTRVLGDDPIRVFEQGLSEAWDLRPQLQALAASRSVVAHSDNFPILEFRWAHGVGGVSL